LCAIPDLNVNSRFVDGPSEHLYFDRKKVPDQVLAPNLGKQAESFIDALVD